MANEESIEGRVLWKNGERKSTDSFCAILFLVSQLISLGLICAIYSFVSPPSSFFLLLQPTTTTLLTKILTTFPGWTKCD